MAAKVKPSGFHTITPALTVRDAAKAIDFYIRAFGARERMRMPGPEGKGIMHAELEIGDSCFFLGDECPGRGCQSPESLGGCTGMLNVYVADVDAVFRQALDAGAREVMPVADMFWGDRYGVVVDPFGHQWGLLTHIEDLTPEQVCERAGEWMASMASAQKA